MKNKAAFEVKKKDVKVHPSWESSVGGFQGTSVPCHNTWICLQWPELLSIAGFMPLPWELSIKILTHLAYLFYCYFHGGFLLCFVWLSSVLRTWKKNFEWWENHDCMQLVPLEQWESEGSSKISVELGTNKGSFSIRKICVETHFPIHSDVKMQETRWGGIIFPLEEHATCSLVKLVMPPSFAPQQLPVSGKYNFWKK